MGNPFGRADIVPLTNKSGGSVAAGDVVILDSANNTSFTTTTSANVTTPIGIAQQTIANNAVGLVLISGYASLVNVNASVTRLHYGATYTVAKQATDAGASRAAGTFCVFLSSGTTPDALVYPVDLAGAALTNPMTTAEDIIKGGTAGAPARLAKGAAGAVLAMSNGAVIWNAGSSFPGSPATNDRYYRTDLGLDAYYDGTRWLCTCLHTMAMPIGDSLDTISTSSTVARRVIIPTANSIWLQTWRTVSQISTTNNGTNFWTVALREISGFTTVDSFTTAADTHDVPTRHDRTINASWSGTTYPAFDVLLTKTLTPGSSRLLVSAIDYRLILT